MTQTNPQFVKAKSQPHYRYFFEQIKTDYQKNFLTAKGAVVQAVRCLRRMGHKLRITNKAEFASALGMSRATFYRAINELGSDPESGFCWEDVAGIDVWLSFEPKLSHWYIAESPSFPQFWGVTMIRTCDNDSELRQQLRICDIVLRNRDFILRSDTNEAETPNKNEAFSPPPDLSHRSTDLSLSQKGKPQKRERGEIDPKLRAWLKAKADRLPDKPQLLEKWIQKQARDPDVLVEYENQQSQLTEPKEALKFAPDRYDLELTIQLLLNDGDRRGAFIRLQRLWDEGWHDFLEQLLSAHQNWHFAVGNWGLWDELES